MKTYLLGLSLLIIGFQTRDTSGQNCPHGWSELEYSIYAYCYKAFEGQLTWFQAQAACAKEAALLASIPDQRANDLIDSLTESFDRNYNHQIHIGGSEVTENSWAWVDGVTSWNYTNWDGPTDGGCENCLSMLMKNDAWNVRGRWNDVTCNEHTWSYVCSKIVIAKEKQELQAASAILSSTYAAGHLVFEASRCIDGNTGYDKDKDTRYDTMCHTNGEIYPWLALDLGKSVSVRSVKIYNRQGCCGDRLRDCEIRISDNLPTTPATESFKGGATLGLFEGPGKNGEVIEMFAERPLAGRYIVIMNNSKGRFGAVALNLAEVTCMGYS